MNEEIWPLETAVRSSSMENILKVLSGLTFEKQENVCMQCSSILLDSCVRTAYERTKGYFHGLCLDCMDKSKPRFGDEDKDYWRHCRAKEDDWISGCRIKHRQPTWYYSFMGRQERRDMFRKQRFSREHDDWIDV